MYPTLSKKQVIDLYNQKLLNLLTLVIYSNLQTNSQYYPTLI